MGERVSGESLHRLPGAESPEARFLEAKKELFPNPHHSRAYLSLCLYQLYHLFVRNLCVVCSLTIRQHFATIRVLSVK